VKRHLAENIYDYLPWIFKYSTDRKIRIFASLLFNWRVLWRIQANPRIMPIIIKFPATIKFLDPKKQKQCQNNIHSTMPSDNFDSIVIFPRSYWQYWFLHISLFGMLILTGQDLIYHESSFQDYLASLTNRSSLNLQTGIDVSKY
jgi:hypothetical protein